MPEQWRVFDLVEAFQLSHAVATLHDLELFKALKKPATAKALSARYGLDAGLLRGILEFVAARTDLLRKSGERFVTTQSYTGGAGFLLNMYVGTYGGNAARLAELLRDPSGAEAAVNRVSHAKAFESLDDSTLGVLPGLIRQLDFNHLLDLGCGSGALLLALAGQDPEFVGWGIDFNPAMCRAARGRIREARLGRRLRVMLGDSRDLSSALPTDVSARVRAVTACDVANEMFTDGHSQAVKWLRGLRRVLPGRPLLIADYYGRLGHKRVRPSRETLLHDFAQVISGQGVPPPNAAGWRAIYSRAGCKLIHVIEDKTTTRFIHILRL